MLYTIIVSIGVAALTTALKYRFYIRNVQESNQRAVKAEMQRQLKTSAA